jgi:hypothetical protein
MHTSRYVTAGGFQCQKDGHTSMGRAPLAAHDTGQDNDLGGSLLKADSFETQ